MSDQPWFRSRRMGLGVLVGLMLALASAAASGALHTRHVPEKPQISRLWPGLRSDLLIVKFVEGSQIRLREGRLVSLTHQDVTEANQVLVGRLDLDVARLFSRSEQSLEEDRVDAELRSGKEMADLNNYYKVRFHDPSAEAAELLLDELNALPIVEIAYAEPIPELATFSVPAPGPERGAPMTPDFQGLQGYLGAAPDGVDALTAWTYPGGRGETVKVIDIEVGWNWDHEDMKVPFFQAGPSTYSDHGVAVVGVFASVDNGFGVTGISNAVDVGSYNVDGVPTADAFDQAVANLDPGDIFVIELHCPGPAATGSGQYGFIALEWWQANFDAIAMATANGIICCEAAGNGEQDFDSPIYLGLFNRNVRDSGAIIVGATDGRNLVPAGFTNYGSRIDLSGWGYNVVTTGYGDLQGGARNEWYTARFSGTSSATPIVTGAVACMQGAYKEQSGGTPLSGNTIAQVLRDTGTPIGGTRTIGPRPNLALAIPALLGELASIEGIVTDAATEMPLADAEVRIIESGTRTTTAADGSYALPIPAGSWTVRATKFGYGIGDEMPVVTTAGAVTPYDVALAPLPTNSIGGTVTDEDGAPIVGAEVSVAGTPLLPAITGVDGSYVIEDVPAPMELVVVATAAGRAPDARTVHNTGGPLSIELRLATPEDFEGTDGGFTRWNGEWQWGIPTYAAGPEAHSGQRCWGTDLTGPYSSGNHHILDSPTYDLAGLEDPRLAFWHWYSIWGPYDGANVSISTNGGSTWQVIEPVGGYPDACIDGLGGTPCEPGWTNGSGGWLPVVFELAGYEDQSVRFRFDLGPWGYSQAPGWYIDDLSVHGGGATVAAGEVRAPERFFLAAPSPSPSRGPVTVTYELAAPAPVELVVFDVAGRPVRSLSETPVGAGPRTIRWDGLDGRGQRVAPGIYFLRLSADRQSVDGGRESLTRKLVVVE